MTPVSAPRSADVAPAKGRGPLRVAIGVGFALVTIGACILLGNRFTHTSWPLQRAHMGLVAASVFFYFVSYVFRALGWQKLFPASERPDRARCLTACGAAAASGVVLPFRLDYVVKIGTLRRMRGVKLGLEAIALSIISLGLVDAVAFLPLSISATATSSSTFRAPLLLVVLFGVGSCGLLVGGQHLLRLPIVARHARVSKLLGRVADHPRGTTREAITAWFFLLGCWSTRALGSTLLLAALGVGFSPTLALVVLCFSAAAALIPIASGGAVANVGATAAVLLALGVHSGPAINFGLASGLLLCGTAVVAAIVGLATSLAMGFRARSLHTV
ncbi:MAG TPA: lysylphosphatidylglycerol synthase domain-containing protein [Gaiellaceae bacterium]|nr:lysylphosphatidylglycerol synthase domain-containing protein [Gaiellaceae bacterium]